VHYDYYESQPSIQHRRHCHYRTNGMYYPLLREEGEKSRMCGRRWGRVPTSSKKAANACCRTHAPAMSARQKKYKGTPDVQAVQWVGEVIGRSPDFERLAWNMHDCLKTGVALCDLVTKLGAKGVKPNRKPSAKTINHRENITTFVGAAKALGLKDHETFVSSHVSRPRALRGRAQLLLC
jgi:hypothetical protein